MMLRDDNDDEDLRPKRIRLQLARKQLQRSSTDALAVAGWYRATVGCLRSSNQSYARFLDKGHSKPIPEIIAHVNQ